MFELVKRLIPDALYLKIQYRRYFHRGLDLNAPRTYNEKLNWLKLYDRNPLYVKLADKYEMKKYVSDVIGEKYVVPVYGIWSDVDEIDFKTLPYPCVLKTTHDSGGIVICKKKEEVDLIFAKAKLSKSLHKDFYYYNREWCYKHVPHRILAEQYIEDSTDQELRDYKFFCFGGIPRFLFVATGRASGDTRFDFFDMDYNWLDVAQHYPHADQRPHKPHQFELMKELAKKLSSGIPQVRIDFFEANGQIYVGEFTFYHFGGFMPFEPDSWDYKFGEMLQLPSVKRRG